MIKVFTLNKNNKIELTQKELEELLNESFWEGYNKNNTYVYTSPYTYKSPYWYSTTTANANNITVKSSDATNTTITYDNTGE